MFDVGRTPLLAQLLAMPGDRRDDAWMDRFFDAAWTGSIYIPAANSLVGPDGFRYYRLVVPQMGEPFDSHCLGALVPDCLALQSGAAFFLREDDPSEAAAFVCSLGLIDSLLRYDSPHGDPIDAAELAEGATDRADSGGSVLLGTPSADFLPPVLASALHRFLAEEWGMKDPRVQIMVDTAMRPSRALVISRKPSEFPEGSDIAWELRRVQWFLDPNRMAVLMPEDLTPRNMTPLRQLF